jgi:phage tail P2-like protein
MHVSELDLLKLQTKNMQKNIDVQGFSSALSEQFQQIAKEVINVLTYTRIDELSEDVLDILAWQFNVDWYDAESDLTTKRQAINDALIVSQMMGTPAAVQRVVEIYFGDGNVEEWFEYGGEPYHFRVVTNNPSATQEQAALLAKAVNSVKNLRSRLESVIIQQTENMDMYVGFVLHTGDKLTMEQVV